MLDVELRDEERGGVFEYTCTVTEYPITVNDLRRWQSAARREGLDETASEIRRALAQGVRTEQRYSVDRVALVYARDPAGMVAEPLVMMVSEMLASYAHRAIESAALTPVAGPAALGEER